MTDQYFKYLVSNCLALECLTIKHSGELENVSIVGLSKLKLLNLSSLWGVKSIVIRDAISLVSLTCCEWRSGCSVQLNNLPKLTKLDLRDCRNSLTQVEFLAQMPSCIRGQLHLLRLSSESVSMMNLGLLNDLSLQLVNIRHLELVIDTTFHPDCYHVSRYGCRLVEACGSLEKLVLQFLPWTMLDMEEFKFIEETYDHPRSQKYLEIVGYSGHPQEQELVLYITNNATSLQKLILGSDDTEKGRGLAKVLMTRRRVVQEDRISELPNDILISIISRLTIREATATCILSTCWRHLHHYVTHLNFPKYEIGETVSNYLCIVNHVLNSHKGRIKELRVDWAEGHERWFEFGLTKKAERIHIAKVGIEFHGLPNGLECLKELSLSSIEISDQELELLVSNCLVLECLTVEYSSRCENVSIVRHSKLKHLKLTYLQRIRSIMIHDLISLVCLTCRELRSGCSVQLSYIPKLTKLDLGDSRNRLMDVEFLAGVPSCIRDQLKLLRLSSQFIYMYELNHRLLNNLSLQLVNITHLQFVLDIRDDSNWHYVSSYACRWVEACASLQKLVIKFLPSPELGLGDVNDETYDHCGCDLSLKYLEISGYSGFDSERRLALNLINNVTSFQKMIVVACDEEALALVEKSVSGLHADGAVDSVASGGRGSARLEMAEVRVLARPVESEMEASTLFELTAMIASLLFPFALLARLKRRKIVGRKLSFLPEYHLAYSTNSNYCAAASWSDSMHKFVRTMKIEAEEFNAETYDHPKHDLSLEMNLRDIHENWLCT
ncbi:hypothetical protein SASPL_137007 [Salvia splendens]|uniref:F-box domain-containing protein n=1 Tax=Salvia splendens TaxID=180675 RepID=A0A8X8ZCJ6_SALSN|nr:hypothetical protein SASPL_137007 [Salvia splendens]